MFSFDFISHLLSILSSILLLIFEIFFIAVFLYGLLKLLSKKKLKTSSLDSIKQESYESRYTQKAFDLWHDIGLSRSKKNKKKVADKKACVYVLDFDGDIRASQAESFAHLVSTLKEMLQEGDKILLRLQSSGGLVPHYGYAATQLTRLRESHQLTVAIDKVAASGGYLMACTATEIIAAPFAVVGSIGVVGVVPHLHPWLKSHGVEIKEHTAGSYKRSLTPWTEHTPEKVQRYQEELQQTHQLFQNFVRQHRPDLDNNILQTGEYRYAADSVGPSGLVDRIMSSDDFISQHLADYHVVFLSYEEKTSMWQRFYQMSATVAQLFGVQYAQL